MSKVVEKLKEEGAKLIPPTIFFFFALHIVAVVRTLMLKGTGIPLGTSVSIFVAALILGKAVLIADMLPFINRYPNKPLAYNITWKTAIYVLMACVLHYLERLFEFWRHASDLASANRALLAEIVWPHFLAIQLILVILILMYCTMREVVRAIGVVQARQMFFGPPPFTKR